MTGGALIRCARQAAGLTQIQLGERSGFPQSTISAYESDKREPGFGAVARIVAAAGFTVSLSELPTLDLVRSKRIELAEALASLGGRNIRVFGSVARGDDGPLSDVDLLVDVDPDTGLFAMGGMQEAAERILSRPVDIIPASGLRPSIAGEVLREAVAL